MLVRASIGTLAAIGMLGAKVDVKPKTCYLLQYSEGGCDAGCLFCPQSSSNMSSKELVSRIPWPVIELEELASKMRGDSFSRICFQTVLKRGFEREAVSIVGRLRGAGVRVPFSVGTTPVSWETLQEFRSLAVDYVGVGLDAASAKIFEEVKKPFRVEDFWSFIEDCVKVFGTRHVYVHLIYGLGEKDIEFASAMGKVYELGAEVALFSFTPVRGTRMEHIPQPEIESYRMMQIIRYFLSKGYRLSEIISIEEGRVKLKAGFEVDEIREAFLTSGCPACNRPFYNERPTKIYNYPSPSLLEKDFELVREQVKRLLA